MIPALTLSDILNGPLTVVMFVIIIITGPLLFPTRREIALKFKKQADHDKDIKDIKDMFKSDVESLKKDIKEHISLKIDNVTLMIKSLEGR